MQPSHNEFLESIVGISCCKNSPDNFDSNAFIITCMGMHDDLVRQSCVFASTIKLHEIALLYHYQV